MIFDLSRFFFPFLLLENNPENSKRVCLSLNGDPALNDDSV
jgi:hypothetical protein